MTKLNTQKPATKNELNKNRNDLEKDLSDLLNAINSIKSEITKQKILKADIADKYEAYLSSGNAEFIEKYKFEIALPNEKISECESRISANNLQASQKQEQISVINETIAALEKDEAIRTNNGLLKTRSYKDQPDAIRTLLERISKLEDELKSKNGEI
ncbi:hypothetical protein [Pseudomonas juntendi]|uniref:hypothetical protein n=1 Tax=Pseudomonas juntendi TaxID=2666183 RepID=UPI001B8291EA|nr:hypothetical protein [Pseudomonas juntendi]MBR7522414.1 hypothetical protein [Pseudomonas juntendi]